MNEETGDSLTSLILISELAILFAVILAVILVINIISSKKKKKLTQSFLNRIKEQVEERSKTLKASFGEIEDVDEKKISSLVEGLIESEKKVYVHIAQLYLGHKPETLLEVGDEMKSFAECSLNIFKLQSGSDDATENGSDDDGSSHELKKQIKNLRDEKKELKQKNSQLQVDFDAAMDSMERMTTEFANMYEGGSKDGEKRVKNEMYQLRQTLAKKKEITKDSGGENIEDEDTGDGVPDMDISDTDDSVEPKAEGDASST